MCATCSEGGSDSHHLPFAWRFRSSQEPIEPHTCRKAQPCEADMLHDALHKLIATGA